MKVFFHIVWYKILSSFKSTFDTRKTSIVRGVGSTLMFGTFAYAAYFLAFTITDLVITKTHVGLFLYHQFLSMLLFVFFMAVNLGNILVAYSTLYKSPEVGYLLTKPVASSTVFLLKFLDNFFYSSGTLFIMGFSVLLGYGKFFGHSYQFFIGTMVFVFLPFMFLAACLAVLILMAIIKFASWYGFRRVMTIIFLMYFSSVFIFFKAMNPIKLVEEAQWHFPNVDTYLSQISFGVLDYFPNSFVARYLYHSARGEAEIAIPYAVALVVVTLLVFLFVVMIARGYYYKSWLISLQIQAAAKSPYSINKFLGLDFRHESKFSLQTEVLLKKEFIVFFREPSQWLHLLLMVVLLAVFIVSTSHLNLFLRAPTMQLLTYMSLFAFSGFMVAALALRFIFPTAELEGKAFWSVRTAPITLRKWMVLKIFLGILLVLISGELISLATHVPFLRSRIEQQPLLLWFGIYSTFWMSLTMVFVHFGLGCYFASYKERNPIRAASTQGATITFLGMMLYLITVVVIVLVPLSAYFQSLYRRVPFYRESFTWAILIIGGISLVLVFIGWRVGARALERDF